MSTRIAAGMDYAARAGMPSVRLLTAAILTLLPTLASAQPWADAYRAGDHDKAATLLHEIVADDEYTSNGGDPAPLRQLAFMYAKGLGVARDAISACTLAQFAEMATMQWAPRQLHGDPFAYQASLNEAERFKTEYCAGLSDDERLAAMSGCPGLAMPETTLDVGGQSVRVGRRGVRLADAPEAEGTDGNLCAFLNAGVQTRSVAAPPDAAPGVQARHFVEVFSWLAGRDRTDGRRRYVLRWVIFEVTPKGAGYVAQSELLTLDHLPHRRAPLDLEARVALEMIRSGHVRWRMPGAPPRRGWIMRPEERTGHE